MLRVILRDSDTAYNSIVPVLQLLLFCYDVQTFAELSHAIGLFMMNRRIRFLLVPGWRQPVQLHQPHIILVNHSYELFILQSIINLTLVQQHTSLPVRIVCNASYTTHAPSAIVTIMERVLAGHIRIDHLGWTSATKERVMVDEIRTTLANNMCVVIFGDDDALQHRNPLRTLFRQVLTAFPDVPKVVFHIEPYHMPASGTDYNVYFKSQWCQHVDDIVQFRTMVDDRFHGYTQQI